MHQTSIPSQRTWLVFISHAGTDNKDREWVSRLVDALLEEGLDVWYDEREIHPGDSWLDQMEAGLRESAYVVSIITPESARSNWAAAELGAALALRKPVIPIVADDTPPEAIPGPIRLRKYVRKSDPKIVAAEIARGVVSERKSTGDTSA
jgi:hypothetical protein